MRRFSNPEINEALEEALGAASGSRAEASRGRNRQAWLQQIARRLDSEATAEAMRYYRNAA